MDTTTTAEPASDRLWEELVTSALLGTDRRAPTGLAHTAPGDDTTCDDTTGGDAAVALLDAAALHTV
ncbi:hypothetical protein AB9128_31600, partial [Streptomyces cinereoruber]|uniref:hypothetical protein n=1 Tax=Streptomyces cinereoruber TaxID=67260 RepID=UPI003EB8C2FC